MTKEIICKICGGDLASNRHPALKMHQSLSTCIKTLRARAEAAKAELANYKQWHEQEQIRAVDAEHQWGELVGELIPALGLPDEACGDNAGEVILAAVAALQARAKAAEEKLSTIRYCARYDREVNKDAVDGKTLPQWISLLYLAYIGDYMAPDVLGQIERGSLFFPNAPIYAERDAALARAEAAEAELAELAERHENAMAKLKALIEDVPLLYQRVVKAETRLAELEAAARWRPVADPPGRDGYYKTACIDLPSETDRVYYSRVGGWDYDIDFWQPLPAGGNGQKENEMVETADNESTALMARIDELEELARWRPVSPPPVNDAPVLALLESGEYAIARCIDLGEVGGVTLRYWRGTGGPDKHVAAWRPIVVPVTEEAPAE